MTYWFLLLTVVACKLQKGNDCCIVCDNCKLLRAQENKNNISHAKACVVSPSALEHNARPSQLLQFYVQCFCQPDMALLCFSDIQVRQILTFWLFTKIVIFFFLSFNTFYVVNMLVGKKCFPNSRNTAKQQYLKITYKTFSSYHKSRNKCAGLINTSIFFLILKNILISFIRVELAL